MTGTTPEEAAAIAAALVIAMQEEQVEASVPVPRVPRWRAAGRIYPAYDELRP